MPITWHDVGDKKYETGVDRGVFYIPDDTGAYGDGEAWNGLVSVTESPSGAEPTKEYADNSVYATLMSLEEFGATIECFTYPDGFARALGEVEPQEGVFIGQQNRETFGFSYRTLVGNDVRGNAYGYKLHLVYGALAGTSDKANNTINDTPEMANLSYEITTTPVLIDGMEPAAHIYVDSTKVSSSGLTALEDALYGRGSGGSEARLPLPSEVLDLVGGGTG